MSTAAAAAAAPPLRAIADAELDFLACQLGDARADGGAALRAHVAAVHAAALAQGRHLYKCVRELYFLEPRIARLPAYAAALARGAAARIAPTAGAAARAAPLWLDLGCGTGTDARRIVADGWPAAELLASDVTGDLWSLGLALFKDAAAPPCRFLLADATDGAAFLARAAAALPRGRAAAAAFHVVSAVAVLHTLTADGVRSLLRTAHDALLPGEGVLLGSCVGSAAAAREWPTPNGAGAALRWLHSAESLAAALRAAGFADVEVAAHVRPPRAREDDGAASASLTALLASEGMTTLSFSARAPAAHSFLADVAVAVAEAAPLLGSLAVLPGAADEGDFQRSLAATTRDAPPLQLRILLTAGGGAECLAAEGGAAAAEGAGTRTAGSLHELLMGCSPAYGAAFLSAVASRVALNGEPASALKG